MSNPMAQAWLVAGDDLCIRVVHPFVFRAKSGVQVATTGVYLPDFGCDRGTLLTSRFDAVGVFDAEEDTDYFTSALNPHYYEPYDRQRFIQTLSDWGWFGRPEETPNWYDPNWRSKLVPP